MRSELPPRPAPASFRGGLPVGMARGSATLASVSMIALLHAAGAAAQTGPLDEAVVLAELNDTDGDLGFHALVDGDGYRRLKIRDPNRRVILDLKNRGRLARQGVTELFFESAEPDFEEFPPARFFRRFPAGEYRIVARTIEGGRLRGVAEFSHVLPAPADGILISGDPPAEDCDDPMLPVIAPPVVISWAPVTTSHPEIGESDPDIEIVGYQFVVELEEPELLVFSLDLPPEVTEVEVPPELLALGDEFKFEIIAREASGNQTAVENCFVIAG